MASYCFFYDELSLYAGTCLLTDIVIIDGTHKDGRPDPGCAEPVIITSP